MIGDIVRTSELARTGARNRISREEAEREAAAACPLTPAQAVEARLWQALQEVEDPEIPISVVGMGLIVSLAWSADERAVDIELTYTAMGCPAMEFIEGDVRDRLLQEPEVDEVRIEVVWDPVWTRSMIREEARATMRRLGIVA
jgi:metal-sulfur cluster biosynthetic enzyme